MDDGFSVGNDIGDTWFGLLISRCLKGDLSSEEEFSKMGMIPIVFGGCYPESGTIDILKRGSSPLHMLHNNF